MIKERGLLVGDNLKRRMGMLKEKLLEKLSAAATTTTTSSSPFSGTSDDNHQNQTALENAKNFIESAIRDVSLAAQVVTKDALQRIKSRLVDIFRSLTPALTSEMVDDAEKEVISGDQGESGGQEEHERQFRNQKVETTKGKGVYGSPIVSTVPVSKL